MATPTNADWQDAALSWLDGRLKATAAVKALAKGIYWEVHPLGACCEYPSLVTTSVFSSDRSGGCTDSLGGNVLLQVAIDAETPGQDAQARKLSWAIQEALTGNHDFDYYGIPVRITVKREGQIPPIPTQEKNRTLRRTGSLWRAYIAAA